MEENLDSQHNLGHGIFKYELQSWDEIHEHVMSIFQFETYVYRGQPFGYKRNDPEILQNLGDEKLSSNLLPSILREFNGTELSVDSYKTHLQDHLKEFRKALKGRTDILQLLNADNDEAWALGQHYGLKTPFLDFTYSPYVAAFFALISADSSKSEYCSVYAVSQLFFRSTSEFKIYEPKTDHNQRLMSQSGLFVKFFQPKSIEQVIRNTIEKNCSNVILAEILIPTKDRERALKHLESMNISYRTLFPDLQGSSEHANELLRKRIMK